MENLNEKNIPQENFKNGEIEKTFLADKVKIVVVIIIIAILAVVLYAARVERKEEKPEEQEQEVKKVIIPEIARTPENNLQKELPANFPKEIPLNGKTKIIESYSATYPNSTIKQSTISFESKNTPKQNYDFYLKWAKDNKWEVVNESNEETLKSLSLRKENKDLNIVITNKIAITYVES